MSGYGDVGDPSKEIGGSKIRFWIEKHEVLSYFLLTFIISWCLWIPLLRLYFDHSIYLVGVPLSWGLFGPAFAGILITGFINRRRNVNLRKKSLRAFLFGWVLSAFVWITFIYTQAGVSPTREGFPVIILMGLLISISPAYVLSAAFGGNESVRGYLQSLIQPRGRFIFYLIAFFVPIALYWLGFRLTQWFGLRTYWNPPKLSGWGGIWSFALTFFFQCFFANLLGEEVGWRGFALPRLQARFSPLVASTILAPIWFAWHLPFKLGNPDLLPMGYYAISFLPSTILLAWLYNHTNGSILVVGIAHVASNMAGKMLFPTGQGNLIAHSFFAVITILVDRMWERTSFQSSKGNLRTVDDGHARRILLIPASRRGGNVESSLYSMIFIRQRI